jgi:hypothetical protein
LDKRFSEDHRDSIVTLLRPPVRGGRSISVSSLLAQRIKNSANQQR